MVSSLIRLVIRVGLYELVGMTGSSQPVSDSTYSLASRLFLYFSLDTRFVFMFIRPLIISPLVGVPLSVASLASWYSDSFDFALLARLIGSVFHLPSTPRLALFCPVACGSPVFVITSTKQCFGSGFVKQSAMFTSVSIFQTSSFFYVTSSWM